MLCYVFDFCFIVYFNLMLYTHKRTLSVHNNIYHFVRFFHSLLFVLLIRWPLAFARSLARFLFLCLSFIVQQIFVDSLILSSFINDALFNNNIRTRNLFGLHAALNCVHAVHTLVVGARKH